MGKAVKIVAGIALAAAIVVAAPYLGALIVPAAFGAGAVAIATAVAATVLAVGAGLAFSAFSWAPGDAPSGERRGFRMLCPATHHWQDHPPPPPVPEPLAPLRPRFFGFRWFPETQRFAVLRLSGDCMVPAVPRRGWVVLDFSAPIAPGELFCFGLDDLLAWYLADDARWYHRLFAVGMVKQYLGTEPAARKIIYQCTNPPTLCESGLNRLTFAVRVAAVEPSFWRACRRRIALGIGNRC